MHITQYLNEKPVWTGETEIQTDQSILGFCFGSVFMFLCLSMTYKPIQNVFHMHPNLGTDFNTLCIISWFNQFPSKYAFSTLLS